MTRLMDVLKIELQGQFLTKYCITRLLILLQIRNMIDIKRSYSNGLYFFDKNTSSNGIKFLNMSDQQLVEELPKSIIRKF